MYTYSVHDSKVIWSYLKNRLSETRNFRKRHMLLLMYIDMLVYWNSIRKKK